MKVVLITGCSSGLGLAMAIHFASKDDIIVHATVRDLNGKPDMDNALQSLSKEARLRLFVHECNVTSDSSVPKCVAAVLRASGRIDVLINNAGMALIGFSETTKIDEIRDEFEINFLGPVRLLQAVLPYMRKQKSGQIISISSASGMRASSGMGFYGASKSALSAIHEAEGPLLRKWGIGLVLVEPGIVATDTAHMATKVKKGSRMDYKDENAGNGGLPDLYQHTLAVALELFKDNIPYESISAEKFVSIIETLIKQGLDAPTRIQTPGQATSMAKTIWVDPQRTEGFERECNAVDYYLDYERDD